ncbi:succinyl-diaminopimelate desuccinylase [Enterobacteriaceae endosymbiont of Macroplea mutica]|uniref:succinyl-diaminopimelate desuccinylase n=1 Tax=Enterobacteriaceae endosymbiont of Macroplea mutica TaxID=2675791 RepID=UPI00144A298D|nr:succinyl-diaminopimelate desuccinylase [Enterobacteriaceae endosymbiont of Macroplea mutica]QJC31242.1 succinyl-diaminopimelate desuccinylase [Enterobacteriaceae endosymbiont of Macroplea mutica]
MLKKIIEFTKSLIQCPSISPKDYGCQKILISFLQKLNFTINSININQTNNFWAYHANNNTPTLVFAGHTDIVTPGDISLWKYPPFDGVIHNNIMYGRGTCDMKGALAAMVFAAKSFIQKHNQHHGKIAFLITSDEEGTAQDGTKQVINHLMKKKEQIDYCILGEPTSYQIIGDNIKNGRRGSLNITLKIYGIQGHVAYHKLAINPIHTVIPFLYELLNITWEPKNKDLLNTSMQITNLISSIQNNTNVIPNHVILQINFRYMHTIHYSTILDKLHLLLNKYNIYNYQFDWNLIGKPFISNAMNQKKQLISIVKKSIATVNNLIPTIINDGGISDGRFIITTGAQIVELGLINSTIHKIDECTHINDIYTLYKIYYNIMKNILL